MKTIFNNIIYILLSIILFTGCSKDLGNYNYTEVNTIDSVIINPGQELAFSTFSLSMGETLEIKPKVYGSSTSDDKDYTFAWVISGDTVSREKDLVYNTQGVNPGVHRSNLYVYDKTTKATKSYNFVINLAASITRGYYLLAEDENRNAHLFLKGNERTSKFYHYNNYGEYTFGKNPLSVELYHYATSASNGQFTTITVATEEGENPIIRADSRTNLPILLFNRQTSMIFDPVAGGFQPSRVKINQNQGTTSIGGKIRAIANGVVSTDVYNDPLNYDFRKGDYYVNEGTFKGLFLVGYDYRNEKLRVFASKYGAAENTYQTTLDHLIQEDFKGHEVLGGVEDYITWVNSFVLTKNGDDVALHRFDFSQSSVNGYLPNKHIVVARKKMPEMMNQIGIRYRNGAGFWYFASGRKLYRFSNSGFDVQEVLTLPNDGTGDITAWNFDYSPAGQFKYIIVATYNPSSTKEFKGSVYTYAINGTTPLNVETEVTHKVVDLKAGYLPY